MNKKELIAAVADITKYTKHDVEEVVDAVFDTMGDTLEGGGSVTVYGFGTFDVKERDARAGRNPKTGDVIQIAAKKGVRFKPAGALKKRVNAGSVGEIVGNAHG